MKKIARESKFLIENEQACLQILSDSKSFSKEKGIYSIEICQQRYIVYFLLS
jgi:hypothetical protein